MKKIIPNGPLSAPKAVMVADKMEPMYWAVNASKIEMTPKSNAKGKVHQTSFKTINS